MDAMPFCKVSWTSLRHLPELAVKKRECHKNPSLVTLGRANFKPVISILGGGGQHVPRRSGIQKRT